MDPNTFYLFFYTGTERMTTNSLVPFRSFPCSFEGVKTRPWCRMSEIVSSVFCLLSPGISLVFKYYMVYCRYSTENSHRDRIDRYEYYFYCVLTLLGPQSRFGDKLFEN